MAIAGDLAPALTEVALVVFDAVAVVFALLVAGVATLGALAFTDFDTDLVALVLVDVGFVAVFELAAFSAFALTVLVFDASSAGLADELFVVLATADF